MREIRKQLVREGCEDVDRHLAGHGLRKQLLGEAAKARGGSAPAQANARTGDPASRSLVTPA